MSYRFNRSVERAIKLMQTPNNLEDYVSIKIKPADRGCCCFHCYPEMWAEINRYIYPYGPIKDEGDVLLGNDNERFVLECHESGPDLILYFGFATASVLLIKSVVELITTLIKAFQKEPGKHSANLIISKRTRINDEVTEEIIIEVGSALTSEMIQVLENQIKDTIEERKVGVIDEKRHNIT